MRTSARRIWALLLCATISAATLGAARAADQALIDAATKEGEVIWYTSFIEKQLARPLAAAFESQYPGIKVRVVRGRGTDLLVKLLGEAQAGGVRADVHHGGSSVWPLVKANAVQPYFPDSAKDYPADLKDPKGMWTADALYFIVAAINTDLVKPDEAPKSYQDLLDPKWKGKIAWTNSMTQGGAAGFIGTILQSMGEDKGMAYLRALAAQSLVSVPSNQRVVLNQVIGGEYPLAIATFNHHSEISAAKGAPVQWLKLPPVTATLDTVMLLKGPHPNAGKLFIDYSLSEAGQNVVREAGYIPANPKVQAKVARLKPDAGGFEIQVLRPEILETQLEKWIAVYNQLFR